MILGFSGKKYSGKTTAAKYLEKKYGFISLALADPLKIAAREIFDLSDEETDGDLKEVINPFWQMTPRQIMQKMGTEAMRGAFGPDLWVNALFKQMERYKHANFAISDVRFQNEADAIRARGGYVVRIERPMLTSYNPDTHASETELDGYSFDLRIQNDRHPSAFETQLDQLVQLATSGVLRPLEAA